MNPIAELLANASLTRSSALLKLFDERRDIDVECGYPKTITIEQYDALHQREGIAKRVVSVIPEDSWADDPIVYESEDPEEVTDFELAWNELVAQQNVYHYLHRADELSGIGRFGILLLGFNDAVSMNLPAVASEGMELLFMRAFAETNVVVKTREADFNNKRYGQPVLYSVQFQEESGALSSIDDTTATVTRSKTLDVHWTRVIHLADNRTTSEIFGTPRMKPVFNRLLDIRKVLSGSGEMFWKGAFPGYSFEMSPEAASEGVTLDADSLREEFENYSNGLQRYLAVTGLSAKSLAPQVADPTAHIETQMRYIAITLSIPYRIFLGTEEARLASSQDVKTWNKRINRRQDKYITPMVLRPLIDRLIELQVLPAPVEDAGYVIEWPDLNSPTDQDKAEHSKVIAESLAKYIGGQVDTLIPPQEWMSMIMGMSVEEVRQISESAEAYITGGAEHTHDDDVIEE